VRAAAPQGVLSRSRSCCCSASPPLRLHPRRGLHAHCVGRGRGLRRPVRRGLHRRGHRHRLRAAVCDAAHVRAARPARAA